ncbi:unnamed protein product [Symbiodinium pilosum]|uniref:Tyr recombinase domain-containing protein n=1 Tax=Symbiodinium pilosum TaxID=2952 RepID=A0A812PDS7_SYMPI|nr:unnamed protein product [Symbiodinium pilosum]
MSDPTAAWRRAFGSRRAGTLKNRPVAWEAFLRWLEQAEATARPSGPGIVLQHFQERFEGGTLYKTTSNSFLGSLFLLEQVGQVLPADRLSSDTLITEAVKSWSTELETYAPAVRQAPMFSIAILLALEITLVRTGTPPRLRFGCFMLLIMVWSALRRDDLQSIDPSSLSLSQLGLKFTLRRTKTSGPGKKLGALQGFILRAVSLSGYDWVAAAWGVLRSDDFNWPRDFLCVHLDENWAVASHASRSLKGSLHWLEQFFGSCTPRSIKGNGAFRRPHTWFRVKPWRSGRAIRQGMSYLHLQLRLAQVIHQAQSAICTSLLEGKPKPGYIEEELLQELNEFGVARGLTNGLLIRAHSVLEASSTSQPSRCR